MYQIDPQNPVDIITTYRNPARFRPPSKSFRGGTFPEPEASFGEGLPPEEVARKLCDGQAPRRYGAPVPTFPITGSLKKDGGAVIQLRLSSGKVHLSLFPHTLYQCPKAGSDARLFASPHALSTEGRYSLYPSVWTPFTASDFPTPPCVWGFYVLQDCRKATKELRTREASLQYACAVSTHSHQREDIQPGERYHGFGSRSRARLVSHALRARNTHPPACGGLPQPQSGR